MYQKLRSDNVRFLRYGARQTDGRTDEKRHIEVGAPPKNTTYPQCSFIEKLKVLMISTNPLKMLPLHQYLCLESVKMLR